MYILKRPFKIRLPDFVHCQTQTLKPHVHRKVLPVRQLLSRFWRLVITLPHTFLYKFNLLSIFAFITFISLAWVLDGKKKQKRQGEEGGVVVREWEDLSQMHIHLVWALTFIACFRPLKCKRQHVFYVSACSSRLFVLDIEIYILPPK